jgi:hypothetical protein
VAAIATVSLGLWGWLANGDKIADAAYKSLALFEINNDAYTSGIGLDDWRFRLGRWTGAGTVFSSLIAVAALLRQHLASAMARWTKQSVVVIGSGGLAGAAFGAARRARKSVLWLGAPEFSSASFGDIALSWPPRDRPASVREHARQADQILIAADDDAEALVFARAARAASPAAHLTVVMRDVRLAEDAAATLNQSRTRVLSSATVAARALMIDHPPFLIARQLGQPRIHALIIGFGQVGQAIARDLIVNCRTTYLELPRLTVIDPAAAELESAWRVRTPEIDACADMAFVAGEVGARAVRPEPGRIAETLAAGGPITAAYICLGDDPGALDAAAMLQSLLRLVGVKAPPIFVRLREASVVEPGHGRGLDVLIPFGDMDLLLEASEFLSAAPDLAARAYSEAYRATLPPEKRDDPKNGSARPWDQLDETYRQANRDAVAHIPAKLASGGVDPALWRGARGLPRIGDACLYRDDAELEALAALEHERWMAQRRMDGWRWTDAPSKDEARRLHPSLVPYAALTDDVQEYDRAYVRETQSACRTAAS